MGVLSDLVVAPPGDAERIGRARAPAAEFGGLDIKGIDSVKVGMLHSILTGRPFKQLLPEYNPVFAGSDEGPWVFRLPADLVTRLASLAGEDKQLVVRQWAATREFALDRWPAGAVARAFDGIAALAQQAEDAGHSLFLWISL